MNMEDLKDIIIGVDYKRILIYIVLVFFAIFYIFPLYSGINTSIKTQEGLKTSPITPAPNPTIQPYIEAFNEIKGSMVDSIAFTVPAVLLSTFLGAMAGYIFSKFRFKYDTFLFFIVVMGFYIPPQSIIIPVIKAFSVLGIYDSLLGFILIHVALGMPICTMLWRDYYTSIPTEIVESARVDGNGLISIFRKIILPLSLPGFIVVGLFQFVNIWNEYFIAISLSQTSVSPLPKAVVNLAGSTVAQWNVQMAGSMFLLLPPLIIFAFTQRYLVRGLMAGAVKR